MRVKIVRNIAIEGKHIQAGRVLTLDNKTAAALCAGKKAVPYTEPKKETATVGPEETRRGRKAAEKKDKEG